MRIEFTDREYRFEHGKTPRGYGYWLFTFEGYSYSATGTLTTAKVKCREYVKTVAPKGCVGTVIVNIEP